MVRKLILILVLFSFLRDVNAQQELRLTLKADNWSIKQFISTISSQLDVKFYYSSSHLPLDRKVNLDMKSLGLDEALDQVFAFSGIVYARSGMKVVLQKMEGDLYQTIRGQIIDKESHQPLTGVTVAITNMRPNKGSITDLDGRFRIEQVRLGRYILQASYLGYHPF